MIEVFDASGTKIFDGSTRLVKFIGTFSIGTSHTGSTQSGTISVPMWASYPNNTPFVSRSDGAFINPQGFDPVITISGNTLTWQYPSTGRPNATYIYGMW